MKYRLPVNLENNELPEKDYNDVNNKKVSYGYVSVMYILSLIISVISVITIIRLGR